MNSLPESAIVAVIGAGTMGAGIAQVAAASGHPVLLFDAKEGAAEAGIKRVGVGLDKLVSRGKMTQVARDALVALMQPVNALADLAPAKLVVEAVVEDLAVKQSIFSALEQHCAEGCIFASNTSSISITAIASVLQRPENVVGMHFFNPAPIMRLVEVVSGLETSAEVAQCIHATASRWGKKAVYTKSSPGFIVNRVARPFYAEALRVMHEQGGDAATIDAVMTGSGGFRLGPFALMDLIGHDVNFAVTNSVFNAYFNDQRFLPSLIQQELVLAGHLGRKTGKGFYDYNSENKAKAALLPLNPPPKEIILFGESPLFSQLQAQWREQGITVIEKAAATEGLEGFMLVGDIYIAMSDGKTATVRAAENTIENLVLVDISLDISTATHVAMAGSLMASDDAVSRAAAVFQALDKQVIELSDVPGLLVLRTVAMLANEAADAVNQGVCSRVDVDSAMCAGVGYPQGPLAWADALGVPFVKRVLHHLADFYGEDRYRCSPLMTQLVAAKQNFHGNNNGQSND